MRGNSVASEENDSELQNNTGPIKLADAVVETSIDEQHARQKAEPETDFTHQQHRESFG